ncbi:nicotinate (nicotinamide) nucleotide adenylyltransferase [Verrucomicrobiales bacterium]|jgi:nicotinate-nucleotide adenylyltransferase|nr:nicotinate (nicotinamide) nucleotide adenylyltransferase [Verrucomicrobiales bacterium]
MGELSEKREAHAVLGGSFDPVHLGHLRMARTAAEMVELERIVFMPCFVSPFKSGTVANAEQRIKMLQIAIDETEMQNAEVWTWEAEQANPSYSWETATHLSELHPEVKWHWIVGTDQWDAIDRWAEPEKLRDSLHFIVLTRDGDPVVEREGWRYTAVPFQHPASSTKIRKNFADNVDWLVPGVADYCREQGLYQ